MRSDPLLGRVTPPDLHIMTLNVRRRLGVFAWPPADRWPKRAPRLRALLANERPSLLGVQEALPSQVAVMQEALGSAYRYVGHGRGADLQGEGCPILYNSERLELHEWSQLALSDTPGSAGSKSWGNPLPRILVRAAFRDAKTGVRFTAFNTHLDPFSSRSRVRAAKQIRQWAARECAPVIVTGDLNSRPSSPPVAALLEAGTLRDAWDAASRRITPQWGTYGGYRAPRANGARIDVIAVSRSIDVSSVGINAESVNGGWASDHLPVQAVVRLTEGEDAR